jgi:hypothetical protein
MMPSGVVSFRVDVKDLKELKKQGINVNEFAKEAFERNLQRARIEKSIEWFRKHPMPVVDPRPVEDIIREMRDSR